MTATQAKMARNRERQRFLRFMVVGAGGTTLDFAILTVLKLAGVATLLANTTSFSAGVVNNFWWNRQWTFAEARRQRWQAQLVQFAIVSLVGLAINNFVVALLEDVMGSWLGQPTWGYLPAKVVATGVVVFWNYLANRHWTFNLEANS